MKRTKLEKWIEETEALPKLTREGLDALQLRRLNDTLARVRARGGFYADYPERLDTLSELRKLPFTTAEELAANPGKFLLTSQSQVSRVISGATSGTTGPAKRVFYTETDTEHTVGFFAAGISEMLSPGESCFIAFPFSGPFGLGDLIARAVEGLGGIPIRAGYGGSYGEMLDQIARTRPETYIGFPVTLLSLARMYGGDFPIRRALVSGDACPAGVMEELESLLEGRLYPHYGSRECGLGGAVTCQAFAGMHLRENHIIPEIIDKEGNVLPEGEYGELVITTVGAEAMPLIRYRTGDYTRILPGCPCGGVTRRIDRISRREGDLSIEVLDSALFRVPGLVDYRAEYDGNLKLYCRGQGRISHLVAEAVNRLYPHLETDIYEETADRVQTPMYPGKRSVIGK